MNIEFRQPFAAPEPASCGTVTVRDPDSGDGDNGDNGDEDDGNGDNGDDGNGGGDEPTIIPGIGGIEPMYLYAGGALVLLIVLLAVMGD